MGSWVTYTAVPAESTSLQEFTTRIGEELRITDLHGDLEPRGIATTASSPNGSRAVGSLEAMCSNCSARSTIP